jgi:hypothetical protein
MRQACIVIGILADRPVCVEVRSALEKSTLDPRAPICRVSLLLGERRPDRRLVARKAGRDALATSG